MQLQLGSLAAMAGKSRAAWTGWAQRIDLRRQDWVAGLGLHKEHGSVDLVAWIP